VSEYTKNLNADLYISDEKVRVETLYKKIKREIKEINIYKDNSNIECEIKLIDMKFKNETEIKETRIISQYTEEIIKKAIENNEKVFIYSTRRGTSPITLCEDCQNIVICNKCNSPVVLHKNFFMCHRCGERRSAEEYCAKCGSWKLKAFGIGIDLVYEKIKEIFPDIPLFKIDSDTTKNDKDIKEIINKWNESKMGVLLGTEMVIQYIDSKVQYSSVIGIDSLLSMPDFRIEERIVTILQNIKSITEKCMVIETRKIEERAFEYFKDNNIDEFYKNILEEREMVGYPPCKTLIKITIAGKRSEIAKEMEELRNMLGDINIDIFPAFTRNKNGEEVLHGLIKLENTMWPNEELLFKLRNLSPAISINTDPESLL
jgi:primosomal protein N' (replication factor Y)